MRSWRAVAKWALVIALVILVGYATLLLAVNFRRALDSSPVRVIQE